MVKVVACSSAYLILVSFSWGWCRKITRKMLPVLNCLCYQLREWILRDLRAGLSVGMFQMPQSSVSILDVVVTNILKTLTCNQTLSFNGSLDNFLDPAFMNDYMEALTHAALIIFLTGIIRARETDGIKIFCCSSISFANMNHFKTIMLHEVTPTFAEEEQMHLSCPLHTTVLDFSMVQFVYLTGSKLLQQISNIIPMFHNSGITVLVAVTVNMEFVY
ncbi:LOW QUALITY PROTEIN: testis anion transporter 1 [Phaethornis superciliosus]